MKELNRFTTAESVAFNIKSRYALNVIGKFLKYVLTELEKHDRLDATTRKIVLDGFGDLKRELERTLLD